VDKTLPYRSSDHDPIIIDIALNDSDSEEEPEAGSFGWPMLLLGGLSLLGLRRRKH